jgi:Transposase domain (DUF772)
MRRWVGLACHRASYFRLLLIGYFEGIDSERGIAWRAADSLALRDFLGVTLENAPPDHSTISRTRRLSDAALAVEHADEAWRAASMLSDAIWSDDLDAVRLLVTQNPHLLREEVLIRKDSNWGPPLTYAANLGRDNIIRFLHGQGAKIWNPRRGGRRCRATSRPFI